MTFAEYQQLAARTINGEFRRNDADLLINSALGMAGEAGEAADHIKKWVYQGHELDPDMLIKEAGDLLWYIAQMATALDIPLSVIAERNIAKLEARYPDGFDSQRSINREA